MKLTLKWFGALLALVFIALLSLPFLIDPNDYKTQISQQFEKSTGRSLNIQGDIELSVFPWIALELGAIQLSNPPGFASDIFASVEAANIRVRLMPLLRKELEMDTIVLDGLTLNLETDAQGRTNWQDLLGESENAADNLPSEPASETATPSARSSASSESPLAAISIAGVRLSDAHILWSDHRNQQFIQLRHLSLETDPLQPGYPVQVKLSTDVLTQDPEIKAHFKLRGEMRADKNQPVLSINKFAISSLLEVQSHGIDSLELDGSADVQIDLQRQLINLNQLKVRAAILGNDALALDQLSLELSSQITANLASQNAELSALKIQAQGRAGEQLFDFDVSTDLQIDLADNVLKTAELALLGHWRSANQHIQAAVSSPLIADITNQQLALPALSVKSTLKDASLSNEPITLELQTNFHTNLSEQTLTLRELTLALDALALSGEVSAKAILSDQPKAQGELNLAPFNLRALSEKFAFELPPMADASTLNTVALSSQFSTTLGTSIELRSLDVRVDQSHLTGELVLSQFDPLQANFKLKLNQIDLDRYLPPEPANAAPSGTSQRASNGQASAAPQAESEFALDALRALQLKGSVEISSLAIKGLKAQNVSLSVDANQGIVRLTPLRAELYGGVYQGNIALDARGDALQLSADEQLTDVQIAPLLYDLANNEQLSGVITLSAKINTQGKTVDALTQNLNGGGQFALKDGAIQGFNVAESIRVARALFQGESMDAARETQQTDFSSLTGSYTIRQGVAHNPDLVMMSPLLRLQGDGTIDLVQQLLDYRIQAHIVATSRGQGGRELADLSGLTIPVQLKGPFDNIKPSVDIASVLKDRASEALKQRATDAARQRLGDDLGDMVGGLLGATPKTDTTTDDDATPPAAEPAEAPAAEPAVKPEDILKDELKDRLRRLF